MAVHNLSDKGTAKELIQWAKDNGIQVTSASEKILEGWQGKVKGLLQVLWERGFIDPNNLDLVPMKSDEYRIVCCKTSFIVLKKSRKNQVSRTQRVVFIMSSFTLSVDNAESFEKL